MSRAPRGVAELDAYYVRTMVASTLLQPLATSGGRQLLVKDERLQPGGSFEYRGPAGPISFIGNEVQLVVTDDVQRAKAIGMVAAKRGLQSMLICASEELNDQRRAQLQAIDMQVDDNYADASVANSVARAHASEDTLVLDRITSVSDIIAGYVPLGLEFAAEFVAGPDKPRAPSPLRIMLPVKQGLLAAGVACGIYDAKSNGVLSERTQVTAVHLPGIGTTVDNGIADAILHSTAFVQNHMSVSKKGLEAARACLAQTMTGEVSAVSNAAALSLAGALALASIPDTYETPVAILTGPEF
ncbi:MAG TPA: pyridoxal-phosphate dependent enzyme [Candidatus Saccharimonadales bacterium]|nr:pyridoxal-phosphate dependent enzyme [Candidatus Saccharimonadales bacterium]